VPGAMRSRRKGENGCRLAPVTHRWEHTFDYTRWVRTEGRSFDSYANRSSLKTELHSLDTIQL
jgi:hypothetical protein